MAVPIICLDDIWQPLWTDVDLSKFRELLTEAHAAKAWISDGNFALATFDIRLPNADLIVWLETPRIICTWRAIRRVFKADQAHTFRNLPKVLRYIRNFDRVNRKLIEATREKHGSNVPLARLFGTRDTAVFIDALPQA